MEPRHLGDPKGQAQWARRKGTRGSKMFCPAAQGLVFGNRQTSPAMQEKEVEAWEAPRGER